VAARDEAALAPVAERASARLKPRALVVLTDDQTSITGAAASFAS